jgi:zinc protease
MVPTRSGLLVRARAHAGSAMVLGMLALALSLSLSRPAQAMKIQSVKSPGGIEAWLVEDHSVPLMALRFSFASGNAQDPVGKEGLANFLTAMLDEGAGELRSSAYQERMEELAMKLSFEDSRDSFYGNLEMLTANRDQSIALLNLALTKPRFDPDAVERIRKQLLAGLVYAARDPDKVASKEWFALAFDGHSYGRPANGTPGSIAAIGREDLEGYRRRVFAKNNLRVVAVGDIDAAALGKLLDEAFGGLPDKADLFPVPATKPRGGGHKVVEMDVPQSVAVFGLAAMPRKHPEFMPAFVLNHILGGGGFASRLMEEVREKRGLAYSVYSYLQPMDHASILAGSVATKNEAIKQSLEVIRGELQRMASEGPSAEDLENAKRYLVGSYALRFDTSAKIAAQLLGIKEEGLGIDYVEKRNALVEAVTLDDVKSVAARLLQPENLIVTIVGKPEGMAEPG